MHARPADTQAEESRIALAVGVPFTRLRPTAWSDWSPEPTWTCKEVLAAGTSGTQSAL